MGVPGREARALSIAASLASNAARVVVVVVTGTAALSAGAGGSWTGSSLEVVGGSIISENGS